MNIPLQIFAPLCALGYFSALACQGERNFHVLYELVAGASKAGLAKELKVTVILRTYHNEIVLCSRVLADAMAYYCPMAASTL